MISARFGLALLAASALALSQVFASASSVGPPALVSGPGPSPFATGCNEKPGTNPPSVNYENAEVEPFVAVNPVSGRLLGIYQQDRWSDGGAHGLVAARSADGNSWTESWAAFSDCSGNPAYDRASDPWVTFDPNGNAYAISLSASADLITSAVLVAKSSDGGATWSAPTTVIRDDSFVHFNDKESITADPTRPGYVYAVWDRTTFPSEQRNPRSFLGSHAFRGQPMFSRTTDGGATWSTPVGMANSNIFTLGNQIGVLPDGTLVDIFANFRGSGRQPSDNQSFQAVMVSRDAGSHWSPPIKIANDVFADTLDPDNGHPVRAGNDIPDLAVDPRNGTIYAVWADGAFGGGASTNVSLSISTDGGHKWSAPMKVNKSPAGVSAFTPSVAVSSDGTVGVSYYDFRNNTPGLRTDVWFVQSHDGGKTWTEGDQIGGPFDIATAPDAGGYFLGDYEGLATVGKNFLAFFVMANSGNVANRTDVFAVKITE
jgi:BNR repeat-like domain